MAKGGREKIKLESSAGTGRRPRHRLPPCLGRADQLATIVGYEYVDPMTPWCATGR